MNLEPYLSNPPLTHRLEISADRLFRIWLVFALFAAAGAGFSHFSGGSPFVFILLTVMFLIVAGFCWYTGRRARSEFARMRRGDYFSRWTYPPLDSELARGVQAAESRSKVKFIFFFLFWIVFGIGTALGMIGAFAKGDPIIAFRIGGMSLIGGLLIGTGFALPAHFLTGVTDRIARKLDPEVVFTLSGIYLPGRFYPVMDFAPSHRSVTVRVRSGEAGESSRSWLVATLKQGIHHQGNHGTQSVSVVIPVLVPEGKEGEARELAEYYSRAK